MSTSTKYTAHVITYGFDNERHEVIIREARLLSTILCTAADTVEANPDCKVEIRIVRDPENAPWRTSFVADIWGDNWSAITTEAVRKRAMAEAEREAEV